MNKPIRIQRKRTKGWRMPIDFMYIAGILRLWRGAKEYLINQSFVFLAKWILGVSHYQYVKAMSTNCIMMLAGNGIMNIGAKNEKLIHTLLITLLNNGGLLNVRKQLICDLKFLIGLVKPVILAALMTIEYCKLTTKTVVAAKKESKWVGHIEKLFLNCHHISLQKNINYFAPTVTRLKHGGVAYV